MGQNENGTHVRFFKIIRSPQGRQNIIRVKNVTVIIITSGDFLLISPVFPHCGKFQGASTTVHPPVKKSDKVPKLLMRRERARVRLDRNREATSSDREMISRRCDSTVDKHTLSALL